VLHFALECLNQLTGARFRKTNHVDNDVGVKIADALTESPGAIFSRPIGDHMLNGLPGRMRLIGFPLAARDVDDFVSGFDETRHEIGTDMAGPADDDHSHVSPRFIVAVLRCTRDRSVRGLMVVTFD
jgi:hypothetical protein